MPASLEVRAMAAAAGQRAATAGGLRSRPCAELVASSVIGADFGHGADYEALRTASRVTPSAASEH
jgi:hypothetical protein